MTPGRRNGLTVLAAVASCVIFANGLTGYDGGGRGRGRGSGDGEKAAAVWWRPSA
jgi:hypothetical protein